MVTDGLTSLACNDLCVTALLLCNIILSLLPALALRNRYYELQITVSETEYLGERVIQLYYIYNIYFARTFFKLKFANCNL